MIPAVEAPNADFHVSHPPPMWLSKQKQLESINETVSNGNPSWRIERQMKIQFPETRLIQYDCGRFENSKFQYPTIHIPWVFFIDFRQFLSMTLLYSSESLLRNIFAWTKINTSNG